VRVSTQEQAEKGWSIEGQITELYKFCDAREDWKVRWVLKDPGYTAANLDRPGMYRHLGLAQGGAARRRRCGEVRPPRGA